MLTKAWNGVIINKLTGERGESEAAGKQNIENYIVQETYNSFNSL